MGLAPRAVVRFQEVPGFDEGPVFVVRVDKSWVGPIMVVDDSRFWGRGNSGNFMMNVDQVTRSGLMRPPARLTCPTPPV
jgi:hypothetical protein